jgi:hypothetical protein
MGEAVKVAVLVALGSAVAVPEGEGGRVAVAGRGVAVAGAPAVG